MPQYYYKLLPCFYNQQIEGNPRAIVDLNSFEDGRFTQLFVAHGVSIQGFETGCRPIISIDSCHMGYGMLSMDYSFWNMGCLCLKIMKIDYGFCRN